MAWLINPGHLPPECEIRDEQGNITGYRKCHVRLRGGFDSQKAGHDPWPSKTNRGPTTRWTLGWHCFDIVEFLIV